MAPRPRAERGRATDPTSAATACRGPGIGRGHLHLPAVRDADPATWHGVRGQVGGPQPGQGRLERVDPTEEQDRSAGPGPLRLEQRPTARDDAPYARRAAVAERREEPVEHRVGPCRPGRIGELVPAVDHDDRLGIASGRPGPRVRPLVAGAGRTPGPREVVEVVEQCRQPTSVARSDDGADVGQGGQVAQRPRRVHDVDVDLGRSPARDRGQDEGSCSGRPSRSWRAGHQPGAGLGTTVQQREPLPVGFVDQPGDDPGPTVAVDHRWDAVGERHQPRPADAEPAGDLRRLGDEGDGLREGVIRCSGIRAPERDGPVGGPVPSTGVAVVGEGDV